MGYDRALKVVLKHEGGYSNHPSDNGGETFNGIARNFYPKWGGWAIIDNASDKHALEDNEELSKMVSDFYRTYYWYKIKGDDIEDEFIAEMLFNFSINLGKRQVAKKVQRIVGTTADGIIGNITVTALNSVDAKAFTHHFLLEIVEFYLQVSKKRNNKVFLTGWLNRAMNVYYDSERYFK